MGRLATVVYDKVVTEVVRGLLDVRMAEYVPVWAPGSSWGRKGESDMYAGTIGNSYWYVHIRVGPQACKTLVF